MATNIKLLDENALSAIKTYVDTQVGKAGKIDKVKINGTALTIDSSDKSVNIVADGTYNSSSNKIATQTTVSNAIGALDVPASGTGAITGFGAGKTLASLTETDGKIAATFQNIQIAESQVTNLTTHLDAKVPTTRTIAGLALSSDITSASLLTALGLTQALVYIGVATTTKPSAGNYVQTVIGSTTYYVSLTSSGTATQVNAVKGQILTIGTKEYICTTAGASGTNVFSEMGDESSYALKTVTVTGTGALGGGGNLTTNRTITHNELNTSGAKTTAGVYKVKIDKYGHITEATAATLDDVNDGVVRKLTNYVSKQGAETITGAKTFSNTNGTSVINGGQLTLGANNGNSFGQFDIYTSGASSFKINTSTGSSYLGIGQDDGNKIYFLNTIGANAYSIYLPESSGTLALASSLNNYVTLSTAQTITGAKTFKNDGGIILKDTSTDSSNYGVKLKAETVGDVGTTLRITDADTGNHGVYANLNGTLTVNGAIWCSRLGNALIYLGDSDAGGSAISNGDYSIYNSSGTQTHNGELLYKSQYVVGSGTPALSTYGLKFPSTKTWTANRTIATTADIPSNYVTTNTAQTITGTKTFSTNADLIINSDGDASFKVKNGSTAYLGIGAEDGDNVRIAHMYGGTINNFYFPTTGVTGFDTLAVRNDLTGFVTGPSSATSGALALYDGTTGKLIKNSAITTQTNDRGFVFGNAGTDEYNYIRFGSANRAGTHDLVIRNQSSAGSYSSTWLYVESTGTTSTPRKAMLGTGTNHFDLAFIDTFSDGDSNLDFSTLLNHVNNSTIHITSAERTAWNAKISAVKSLKTDATASQSTSSSEALSGSGTITLHRISKTGKLSHLLSDDGGSVSVITTAEINAILYPSA